MTTTQIAQESRNPNFVTAEDPFRVGQHFAADGLFFEDNPFSDTKDKARFAAGYFSVVYAVSDAETAAYLNGGAK